MSPALPSGNSGTGTQDSGLFLLARIVSIAGHPLLLAPLTVAAATGGLRWAAILAATTTVPIALVSHLRVRRGSWTDFDVSRRDQRAGLYYVGFLFLAIAGVSLLFLGASSGLLRGVWAAAGMFALGLAGNRFLKISLHLMIATYCAFVVVRSFPSALLPLTAFVLLIAWSRWYLGRHTVAELITGALIGAAAAWWAIPG